MNTVIMMVIGGGLALIWLASFFLIGVRMSVNYNKVSSRARWFFILLTAGLILLSMTTFYYRDAIFPPITPVH